MSPGRSPSAGWVFARGGGAERPLGVQEEEDALVPLYLYESRVRRGAVFYVSLLGPDAVLAAGGLPRAAILGLSHRRGPLEPRSFRPNALFLELLHQVIGEQLRSDPAVRDVARVEWNGWVEIWDGRGQGPAAGDALDEVFGCFQVSRGRVQRYRPNPHYMLVSSQGLFELPAGVTQALLSRLRTLRVPVVQVEGVH